MTEIELLTAILDLMTVMKSEIVILSCSLGVLIGITFVGVVTRK